MMHNYYSIPETGPTQLHQLSNKLLQADIYTFTFHLLIMM